MSYTNRNGPYGDFTNGNSDNSHLRRLDFESSSRETSADERSRSRDPEYAQAGRPGGYAGLGASRLGGSGGVERMAARRRSRAAEDDYSTSRSRSRPGFGVANSQVEEILRYIEQQWSFMSTPTCIPIKTALQLMDPSSLGLADQLEQFQQTHTQLQNALKVIVNEHHQGFNSSIGTFHKIQAAIHASQQRVRTLRAGLVQARGALGTGAGGRPELKALATNSQQYDGWLGVIATIEQIQLVPERLEAQISEKRFLSAVDTLLEALKLITKPEMEEIGALSDLRVYLSNQEHSLTDILVEELHSHLYLKSPYCEERWKSHTRRDAALLTAGNGLYMDSSERSMFTFLETFDGTASMQEDSSRNPEADTFYYIQLLVESLNKMGKLEVAVGAIEHRLPVELFRVVERSHSEVEQRHPSVIRSGNANIRVDHFGLNTSPEGDKKATLEDLLNTLYAKFEAIAEGHRVLHDVTAAITKRENIIDQDGATQLNRSFRELWKLLQSEIRSLLHDHLASDGNTGLRGREDNAISANIFKPQQRDRNRKLFKISDSMKSRSSTDSRGTHVDLATEKEDLEFILKASVPGLVNTAMAQNAKRDREEDNGMPDRSATGHKLLVEPSVFNMGILLPPSLDFLTRLKDVVPLGSGVIPNTLTSFLDDFLINVFYPQLDETLIDLCGHSMNDLDAFSSHTSWQIHASRPIFKGCIKFYELIESFCAMLDQLPHEQSFSMLVVGQLRAYYDRCYQWSKSLLQRSQMASESKDVRMRLAADLATSGDLSETVITMYKAFQASADGKANDTELLEEETELFLGLLGNGRVLEEADLINDQKSLAQLCTLHTSMRWLASRCRALRFISPRAVDTQNSQPHHNRRWTQTRQRNLQEPSDAYLPLDETTAAQFDGVVKSFGELASLILRTLHIDLRLHVLHGMTTAMSTTYRLRQPYNDPDPSITSLATELLGYDSQLSAHLLPSQYAFLTSNVHNLVNTAFTSPLLLSMILPPRPMNEYGLARMQLNILVLQQCLKGLQADTSLEQAARLFQLAEGGCHEIAEKGRSWGFESETLQAMMKVCWDDKKDGKKGSLEACLSSIV
ncbi:hypothetical protein K431DRAFT_287416 [Polychaeton citri CBS 116435]|uniref:Exocyst complex component Sec8 n=1 Tax=Polychaeton citri CBS 116435 TaxID=1314669 RepID=A0A9P4Q159_9PEZI|nr:hypothetical protein K431DRAFT_287416 [Polychaeton citri CBS 116435]